MRIAFIHPRFPSAEGTGATHSATQIVTGLSDAGHDVCVYCTRSPEENSKMGGMELRHLTGNSEHPHTDTRLNKEVTARLDELREFEIVHSYLTPLIPSLARVGKDSDVGTVVTLNSYRGTCAKNDLLYRGREKCQSKSTLKCLNCITHAGFRHSDKGYFYQTGSRFLALRLVNAGERRLKYIDRFQALSPHVKETYSNFGYEANKIEVIPNILDRRFEIEHASEFEDSLRLLYVGSLKEQKGADKLIDILTRVRSKVDREIQLTIVGDGELRATLEKQTSELGVSDVVEFRGRVPNSELPSVYASHDIFVYPGRWDEPFGRIFLEAMAAGTPIVATDVGSVSDIIGKAGVVTDQSVLSIVSGIQSLLDRETLLQHSKAGRNEIQRFYSSEVLPQFEQLYQSVLKVSTNKGFTANRSVDST